MSSDSFMQPEIYRGEYYSVETTIGTEIVPVDVSGRVNYLDDLKQYLEGQPLRGAYSFALGQPSTGWLARMSAPGYLDCTPWSAYDTEEEAREALMEYDND